MFIYQAFLRRTFSLREANNTIKKVTTPNDIVIGPWAPSVTWDSKCLSIPVWNNFLGGRNIIKDYQPNIIISETDEADSGHAYQLNNIDLSLIGTPFTAISIAHWKLVFYKVK